MSGVVYWFTGVSGVGKTTISGLFRQILSERGRTVIHLDGDHLRGALFPDAGHRREERERLATAYGRFCGLLSEQGHDVVIATISLFHSVHQWNRENIENYREIFLSAPLEVLSARDPKGLYKAGVDMAGFDQAVEIPVSPDIHIVNDGTKLPQTIAAELAESLLD